MDALFIHMYQNGLYVRIAISPSGMKQINSNMSINMNMNKQWSQLKHMNTKVKLHPVM